MTNHEQFNAPQDADPTAGLVDGLEDQIRHHAVTGEVDHRAVLDYSGQIEATTQQFKIGDPDEDAPVPGVVNWITVTTRTAEMGGTPGETTYTVSDDNENHAKAGPLTWKAGDDEIRQRLVGPRRAVDTVVPDGKIAGLIDTMHEPDVLVVDSADQRIEQEWRDGGDGYRYLVSKVVDIEPGDK